MSDPGTPKTPQGFFGSPRTPNNATSSPLSVLRSFAQLSNRGSPLSGMSRILFKGPPDRTSDQSTTPSSIDKENSVPPDDQGASGDSAKSDVHTEKEQSAFKPVAAEPLPNKTSETGPAEVKPVPNRAPEAITNEAAKPEISSAESNQRECQTNEPSPPTGEKPSPPTDEKPSPPTDEKPSPPTDEKPSPPTDEKPKPQPLGLFTEMIASLLPNLPQALPLVEKEEPEDPETLRYEAIAILDDKNNESEKWSDRTSVITKWQHEEYVECATNIIEEITEEVVKQCSGMPNGEYRPTSNDDTFESEIDLSFVSTGTFEGMKYQNDVAIIASVSDESEYESAAEASFVESSGFRESDLRSHDDVNSLVDILSTFQLKTPGPATASTAPAFPAFTSSLEVPSKSSKYKPSLAVSTNDDSFLDAFQSLSFGEKQASKDNKPEPEVPTFGKLIDISFEAAPCANEANVERSNLPEDHLDVDQILDKTLMSADIGDQSETEISGSNKADPIEDAPTAETTRHGQTSLESGVPCQAVDAPVQIDAPVQTDASENVIEINREDVGDSADEATLRLSVSSIENCTGSDIDNASLPTDAINKNIIEDQAEDVSSQASTDEIEKASNDQKGEFLSQTSNVQEATTEIVENAVEESKEILSQTHDAESTEILNQTFETEKPEVLNETHEEASNEILDKTQDAVNKTYDAGNAEVLNKTYDAGNAEVLNKTYDAGNAEVLNKTYDAGNAEVLNKTYDAGNAEVLNQTYNSGNAEILNKTYDAGIAEVLNQTYDAGNADVLNKTYDAGNEEVLNKTYNSGNAEILNKTQDAGIDEVYCTELKSDTHDASELGSSDLINPAEETMIPIVSGKGDCALEITENQNATRGQAQPVDDTNPSSPMKIECEVESKTDAHPTLDQTEYMDVDSTFVVEPESQSDTIAKGQDVTNQSFGSSLGHHPTNLDFISKDAQLDSGTVQSSENEVATSSQFEASIYSSNPTFELNSSTFSVVQAQAATSIEAPQRKEISCPEGILLSFSPFVAPAANEVASSSLELLSGLEMNQGEQLTTDLTMNEIKTNLNEAEVGTDMKLGTPTHTCTPSSRKPINLNFGHGTPLNIEGSASQVNTPPVSRTLLRAIESETALTPRDVEIPQMRPTTPTKRDGSVNPPDAAADTIKRHLFESPMNKPTAIVKPCTDANARRQQSSHEKTCDKDEEEREAEAQTSKEANVSEAQVSNTNMAIGEEERGEDHQPLPARNPVNLDFLDDPNFNPFVTRSFGVRTSFGTSAEPIEETPVAEEETPVVEDAPAAKPKPARVPPKAARPPAHGKESDSKPTTDEGQEKEKKVKKPLPPKPWLRKKASKPAAAPASEDVVIFAPGMEKEESEKKPETQAKLDASVATITITSPPKQSSSPPIRSGSPPIRSSSPPFRSSSPPIRSSSPPIRSGSPPIGPKVPKSGGYNLDFLDKLDDPNFNPFATKAKVVNENQVTDDPPPLEVVSPNPSLLGDRLDASCHVKDSTPEFEAVEKQLAKEETKPAKSSKPQAKTKTNFSPTIPQITPAAEPDEGFLRPNSDLNLSSIKSGASFSVDQNDSSLNLIKSGTSFSIDQSGSSLNFIKSGASFSIDQNDSSLNLIKSGASFSINQSDSSLNLIKSGASFSINQSDLNLTAERKSSIPAKSETTATDTKSHYSNMSEMKSDSDLIPNSLPSFATNSSSVETSISHQRVAAQTFNVCDNQSHVFSMGQAGQNDSLRDLLARKELMYQSQLLDKDKELHKLERESKQMEQDILVLKRELKFLCNNNEDMVRVLEEYERTISELTAERERERVCNEIEKERLARERDQALADLRSVERSFNDTFGRYERMKEIISGFKDNEDNLKAALDKMTKKFHHEEEKFNRLKCLAESKLHEANTELASIQRSREGEIAKLTAMIRKAEMRVSTLERTLEEKTRENQELANICDEIIARVGK